MPPLPSTKHRGSEFWHHLNTPLHSIKCQMTFSRNSKHCKRSWPWNIELNEIRSVLRRYIQCHNLAWILHANNASPLARCWVSFIPASEYPARILDIPFEVEECQTCKHAQRKKMQRLKLFSFTIKMCKNSSGLIGTQATSFKEATKLMHITYP
jgi:hypothetical protein